MAEFLKTVAIFDQAIKIFPKVVVNFTASWCGPCQVIAPKFAAMQGEFPEIKFYKVDVEENSDAAGKAGIHILPTFIFYNAGLEASQVAGSNEDKLRENLGKLKYM